MPANISGASREMRGKAIFDSGKAIVRIDSTEYKVHSQTSDSVYQVIKTESGWRCECPDHIYRDVQCKHIWSVVFSEKIRQTVQKTVISPVVNTSVCPNCKSSKVIKRGLQHNEAGDIQTYACKDCKRRFVVNLGFEKMHASPQVITSAMQLYFTGESLRNVQKFLLLQGVNVGHVTVYRWIQKYVSLMQNYVEKITPNVSDKWRTDELFLKIKGDRKYLFAVMDDQTRFWIAEQVADKKFVSNIRPMFKEANRLTGKIPKEIVSDGASNFAMAINDEYTNPETRPIHTRDINFQHRSRHNNKMERMNGEIRES